MKEAVIYHKLNKLIKGYPILLQRIEVATVPDMFYQHPYGNGWIESKIGHQSEHGIKVQFRPGQLAWIRSCVTKGGQVTMLCLDTAGRLWFMRNSFIRDEYSWDDLTYSKAATCDALNFSDMETSDALILLQYRNRPYTEKGQ